MNSWKNTTPQPTRIVRGINIWRGLWKSFRGSRRWMPFSIGFIRIRDIRRPGAPPPGWRCWIVSAARWIGPVTKRRGPSSGIASSTFSCIPFITSSTASPSSGPCRSGPIPGRTGRRPWRVITAAWPSAARARCPSDSPRWHNAEEGAEMLGLLSPALYSRGGVGEERGGLSPGPSSSTPVHGPDARSIVLWQAFDVAEVFDRLENFQHFGQQLLIERFGGPLGPLADVFRVCRAGDGGRDVGVGNRELERELGDVHPFPGAMCGGFARRGSDIVRFLVPFGERGVRQQARGEGAGVHDADTFEF